MRIIFKLIILVFVISCGYNPIYKSINNYSFNEIILEGNQKLNRQIISTLSLKEDKNDNSLKTLKIETKKNIIATSKNSKGQVQSYRMAIYLSLLILDNKEIIKKKNFVNTFAYSSKENKFELSQYEKQIESDLLKKIIEEINIYFNS